VKQYPISRDGWLYLGVLFVIGGAAFFFIHPWAALLPALLFCFVLYFFRNPERTGPQSDEALFLSPADGVVMDVGTVFEEHFLQGESIRIRIFLSVFNVHVNRAPMAGKVVFRKYRSGQMLPAFKDHASELNEKNYIGLEQGGVKILVTQVTGFIARRIVCWVHEGDALERGERFGLIKFGSCTELFLPLDAQVLVSKGQKVRGGESVVGRVKASER
jgi:phosphatidylserine decarboxylase